MDDSHGGGGPSPCACRCSASPARPPPTDGGSLVLGVGRGVSAWDLGGRQEGDGETEGELATESRRSATPGRIRRTGTGEDAGWEMGEAEREWAIESWEPPQRHRRPDLDDAGSRTLRARLREEPPPNFGEPPQWYARL